MVINKKSEKKRRRTGYHDPSKTTGRDNPKGGPSPALLRANSTCEAQEWKLRKAWAENELRKAPDVKAKEIQRNIEFIRRSPGEG